MLLAAFLVFLGTSGQAVASVLCACMGERHQPVPVRVVEKKEHSCCPEKATNPPEEEKQKDHSDCCCELTAAPEAVTSPQMALPVQAHVHLALPEPLPVVPEAVLVEVAERALFTSDGPPPPDHGGPVRDRAPPVA